MPDWTRYLVLPNEITDFERSYLRRMNRIALVFFWLNLPLFVAVAFFNQTNPVLAALLTTATLAGPTIACWTLDNPRSVSLVHGFTAMCLGGLLVHFGQGPLQIEMHFYFFSLLAVLAMFANPAVILVAAVTVTLHHTVVWAIIPSSVFNYDASIWVVAVHAAFVVVESVAACFISRSFFDNVIGLEKIVAARTDELEGRNQAMSLVLDNVEQGLLTMDRDLVLQAERSAVVGTWFPEGGATLPDLVRSHAPAFANQLAFAWQSVLDGFLPLELTLHQLPQRLVVGERILQLAYRPIDVGDDEVVDRTLVVITDITEQEAARAAEAHQQELMRVFERFLLDKSGFLEFFAEADQIVHNLVSEAHEGDVVLAKRCLHTLKGNALIFGLYELSRFVHRVEDEVVETSAPPRKALLEELDARWSMLTKQLDRLVGGRTEGIELTDREYDRLLRAVREERPRDTVLRLLQAWRLEPATARLERIRQQAKGIAQRLNKPGVTIEIEASDVRMHSPRFQPFWSSFVHLIRNALDHGIETEEERAAAGKPGAGTVTFSTQVEAAHLVVEVADDGRGLDWERLAVRAGALGLPAETHEELTQAMFTDGLSTREEATETSGRGVGLAAVREATEAMGGTIEVHSEPGQGTRFRFSFPLTEFRDDVIDMATPFPPQRQERSGELVG